MKIIAFGNSKYKRIAHNWALYLQSYKIENYTIYSLDQEIYDYLVENNINTEMLFDDIFSLNTKKWTWDARVDHIKNLLNQGHDVLHSDLDAIWLKNPLNYVSSEYDIITSVGTWPERVFKKCGFTACLGWIYYKSTASNIKFLESIVATKENRLEMRQKDDQYVFNNKLFLNKKNNAKMIEANQTEVRVGDIKILVLDQSIISRGQPYNENTYVAHPLSPKHIDREKFLKSKNLWMLE